MAKKNSKNAKLKSDTASCVISKTQLNKLNQLANLGHYAELEFESVRLTQQYPDSAYAWKALGIALYMQGKEALNASLKAAEFLPNDVGVFNHLGHVFGKLLQHDNAVSCFRRALEINSIDADVRYNLANEYLNMGSIDSAVAEYLRVIDIKSNFPDALNRLAGAYKLLGENNLAIEIYSKAIAASPEIPELHGNLAILYYELENYSLAEMGFLRSIQLKPDFLDGIYNLGLVYDRLGQLDLAEENYRKVLTLDCHYIAAANNLAHLLKESGRLKEAASFYWDMIELRPDFIEAYNGLGSLMQELGWQEDAIKCYQDALKIKPNCAEIYCNLANAYKSFGLFSESIASLMQALLIEPLHFGVRSNLIMTLNYHLQGLDKQVLLDEAQFFGFLVKKEIESYSDYAISAELHKKVRVGFVSGDFRRHPVGFFIESILAALKLDSADKLVLIAYSNNFIEDEISLRIKSHFDVWHIVAGMSDRRLAEQIYADQIDVLIDLSGHTALNRLPAFAYRPAPVQVSWLGYAATTGMAEMDYFIADPWMAPAGMEEQFTEQIYRLPDTFLCFTPPQETTPVSTLPALNNDFVTFGCFNNLAKMTDAVVVVWAQILQAVPNSRIMLKSKQLGQQLVRDSVVQRFGQHGISSDRLVLQGESSRVEYLTTYQQLDIALDPFPYTGGTTSVEALWMGVPVLTMVGRRFLSRQGESILQNVGLPHWIAANSTEYIALAVGYANDLQGLATLRAGLRSKMQASPLLDAPRFARNLSAAIQDMWRGGCAQSVSFGNLID